MISSAVVGMALHIVCNYCNSVTEFVNHVSELYMFTIYFRLDFHT